MSTIYLTEPEATLRQAGSHLVVTGPRDRPDADVRERTLLDAKPHLIDGITLVGRTHITSNATQFCLRQGIPVAWLSYSGDYLGRLTPEMNRNADLRLSQCAVALDAAERLRYARGIVAAKAHNAAVALEIARSNHTGSPALGAAIRALKKAATAMVTCDDLERLRGMEGDAARKYFAGLAVVMKADTIPFNTRKKHPATDPANAMLSFGYVLFTNLIAGALEARGLDPAVGFYHEPRSGRSSLALDILEEFRHPLIDRFVVSIANRRILTPEHFRVHPELDGAVRMTPEGRVKFFTAWEKRLQEPLRQHNGNTAMTPLDIMRRQVDRVATAVRQLGEYEPFLAG